MCKQLLYQVTYENVQTLQNLCGNTITVNDVKSYFISWQCSTPIKDELLLWPEYCTHTRTNTYTQTPTHTHIYAQTHTHTCIYSHTYSHIYTYTHSLTHIHIHTLTHIADTHILTHTYTITSTYTVDME